MVLFNIFIYLVSLTVVFTYGKIPNADPFYTFDTDLYESVLDPELCKTQLEILNTPNQTLLRLQFIDAGLRIPKGILDGNLKDLGNYPQCVSINKQVQDNMVISGKYCSIHVPLNFMNAMNYDFSNFRNVEDIHNDLEHLNSEKISRLERRGIAIERADSGQNTEITLTLALCIPRPCTTAEALNGLYFEMHAIHSAYEDVSCRLPNDKPKVAADYIAWVVLSLLVICTVLSTSYDVRHRVVLKRDPKTASELFSSFSAYKNVQNLVKISPKPGSLACLDGIRTLSICWVIVGHSFLLRTVFPSANIVDIVVWATSWRSVWLTAAPFAVDTFFLLSGLLLVYTTANKFTARKLAKNLHIFYLHRIFRMFPVLAAVILFKTSFLHHTGDGPLWYIVAGGVQNCRSFWWVTLLHLQNFLKPRDGCMGETWYLAIDIHLHIISPVVLLWILSGAKRPAWFSTVSAILVSLTVTTIYVFVKNVAVMPQLEYFNLYYVNILTRAPPFFVGMFYGYLLHVYRADKFILTRILGYLTTALSVGLIGVVMYCDHMHQERHIDSEIVNNLFLSFLKPFWVTAVGWLIFACVNGYAAPINWFLSLRVWKIPARISYAMYLVHMSVIYIYYSTSLQPIWFSVGGVMFDYVAFLFLTMFVSFFVTALIDAPFAILFKLLLERGFKSQDTNEKAVNKDEKDTP